MLVVILKKNQRLQLQYHFPKWKIFFNLMLSDKDGENEKKRSSTILVAVGFDLVSSGIDFVTENNARVKSNRSCSKNNFLFDVTN